MSLAHVNKSILDTVAAYEKLLANISEDGFVQTPPDGGWSYAEVFSHIFNSNITCIQAIDRCIQGKAIDSKDPLSFPVKMVFLFRRFPPGKFKVPDRLKEQVVKFSRKEAHQLVERFKDELSQITPRVTTADPDQKLKHPRLGLLNAIKWYEFIDIHTRHHKRQLDRIAKLLQH